MRQKNNQSRFPLLYVIAMLALNSPAHAELSLVRSESPQKSAATNRFVLDNGITLLLYPLEGVQWVAVETLYRIGSLHEPKGMTQAAHLIEHLVCQCATKSYQAGESLRLLNQKAMANAETTADLTHYDYVVAPTELELALRIESERLTSLKIEPALIQQEIPKCNQEADIVESNPKAGMLKFAFMAFTQAWRHGLDEVQLHGSREDFPTPELKLFHRAYYRSTNLIVVLVGEFKRDQALMLVKKHLGVIKPGKASPPKAIDWTKMPEKMKIRWDSKVTAVCLGFVPPKNITDRITLSLWGNLLMQKIMSDAEIQKLAATVFSTYQSWSVGTLPFFVYAAAKPGVSATELEHMLTNRLRNIIAKKPTDTEMIQLQMMAKMLALDTSSTLTRENIRQQAEIFAGQRGVDPKKGEGLALCNIALQAGLRELLLGSSGSGKVRKIEQLNADQMHGLVTRHLDFSRQFVTVLIPRERID
ncbi:MAG: M16 family metallopeptidase [Planctomycetota bacterium]|jgi:predicted Zn-dependent peptidase